MSLEALLTSLTAALDKNNELLTISNNARAEALAAINSAEGGTAPATTRTRRTKAQMEADEAAAKAAAGNTANNATSTTASTAAATESATRSPAVEPVYPTVDALRAAAVAYNNQTGEEKERRRVFMKAIIDEVGIKENAEGKRLITAAEPEDRAKIIGWLEAFARGEKVNFQADNDEAPADDDDIG